MDKPNVLSQTERRNVMNFVAGAAKDAPRKFKIAMRAREWGMPPWQLEELINSDEEVREWWDRLEAYDVIIAEEAMWRLKRESHQRAR